MNSMPRYMANPKAAAVDMHALILPKSPSQGFDRTVSPIMHVRMLSKENKEKKAKVNWLIERFGSSVQT
jgi:hypothetical protein